MKNMINNSYILIKKNLQLNAINFVNQFVFFLMTSMYCELHTFLDL